MRRPFFTDDEQASRAEPGVAQDGFQLQDVGDGFLVALRVSRLARADAEIEPSGPPLYAECSAQQVLIADVQRRAFDEQPAEDAWFGDRSVQRGNGAVRRTAEPRVRRATRDRIVSR